jgi:protein-L-isoaspartate(D-aspartate) O-methyltransferase
MVERVSRVWSLEIVDELAQTARQRRQRMDSDKVEGRSGNGRMGWPGHSPDDAIVLSGAPTGNPPALIEQLKPGGSLAIPVGERIFGQQLLLVGKDESGRITERNVLPGALCR